MYTAPFSSPALKPTVRMPVLFLGHGSPMNAILDNTYSQSWRAIGEELLSRYPKPQLIVCISAHWLTKGWYLTAMAKPKTIHDFGGFPQALHDQQYPAPGSPQAAVAIAAQINASATRAALGLGKIGLDHAEWGFDHGTWGVLKPMFPQADIPVIQLSLDWYAHPTKHFEMGQQLRALRDQGVLIVASGNTVHNLSLMDRSTLFSGDVNAKPTFDWALKFDHFVRDCIDQGEPAKLALFQDLGDELKALAKTAHPSYDHYLPLLHAAGAADENDTHRYFNDSYEMRATAMRSVIWEAKAA
jgi:4,5-DOPA dioxygenase extradiol